MEPRIHPMIILATQVVEHGDRKRKRGRSYSAIFGEIRNPRKAYEAALHFLTGYNEEENTLCGQPFIGEVNDWAKLYQEHLKGDYAHISFSPKKGIEARDCNHCFYRYGDPLKDCSMLQKKAKKLFQVKPDENMPSVIDGKAVGHYCPFYLNPDAE